MLNISIPAGTLRLLSLKLSLTLFNDVGVEYIFFFIGGYGGKVFFFVFPFVFPIVFPIAFPWET